MNQWNKRVEARILIGQFGCGRKKVTSWYMDDFIQNIESKCLRIVILVLQNVSWCFKHKMISCRFLWIRHLKFIHFIQRSKLTLSSITFSWVEISLFQNPLSNLLISLKMSQIGKFHQMLFFFGFCRKRNWHPKFGIYPLIFYIFLIPLSRYFLLSTFRIM